MNSLHWVTLSINLCTYVHAKLSIFTILSLEITFYRKGKNNLFQDYSKHTIRQTYSALLTLYHIVHLFLSLTVLLELCTRAWSGLSHYLLPKLFAKILAFVKSNFTFLAFHLFYCWHRYHPSSISRRQTVIFFKKVFLHAILSVMWLSWRDVKKWLFAQVKHHQQTKEMMTHISSLVIQSVCWSYSQEHQWLRGNWIPGSTPQLGLSFKKAESLELLAESAGWWVWLLSQKFSTAFITPGRSLVLLTLGTSFESFLYFLFLVWFLCYMNLMTFLFCSRRGVTPQRVLLMLQVVLR